MRYKLLFKMKKTELRPNQGEKDQHLHLLYSMSEQKIKRRLPCG